MLKFLRGIRKKLLHEANLRKPASPAGRYLAYAVGEIILVVIGILIALQINNWNEVQKSNVSSNFYYERLLEDVNADISDLDFRVQYAERVKNAILSLVGALDRKVLDEHKITSFEYALNSYYRISDFSSHLTTYTELVSSGKLELIKNTDLRKALAEYAMRINGNAIVRERYAADIVAKNFFVDKYVRNPVRGSSEYTKLAYDFDAMSNDPQLISLFLRFGSRWENTRTQFEAILERAMELKRLIEAELKTSS